MGRNLRRLSRRTSRKLNFQLLEQRKMLASDSCNLPLLPEQLAIHEPAQAVQIASATSSSDQIVAQLAGPEFSANPQSSSNFRSSDAGSTPGTAARLGSVDGTIQVGGSLSWLDWVDTFQFSIERDAAVQIDLSGLRQNANLVLLDASGNQLDSSARSGRSDEQISGNLVAGEYFVAVQATSLWSTNYQLTIAAQLVPETPPASGEASQSPGNGSVPLLPDVPYYGGSREWNLNEIGAPEAWAAGYTGQQITVAIVDTGVDWDHPDLAQNIFVNPGEIPGNGIDDDGNGFIDDVRGYDFADNDVDPDDPNGHGTHVAGTVAASRNDFGATGVAPDAKILPVRVLDSNGSGTSRDVADGIRYAARMGAQVINLSLGGGYSFVIDAAIDYARSLGSIVVAAAGNEGSGTPGYPALFSATDENVISVGAFNSSGNLAGFSNRVGSSGAVQVDAPGAGVFSTYAGGRYASLSGTSMATPHVAGLAALTLSANPNLTSREVRDLLTSGVIGRAAGSDSIGSINATTTIAYAAAGLTGAPTSNGGGTGSGGGSGGSFGSSGSNTWPSWIGSWFRIVSTDQAVQVNVKPINPLLYRANFVSLVPSAVVMPKFQAAVDSTANASQVGDRRGQGSDWYFASFNASEANESSEDEHGGLATEGQLS